MEPLDAAFLPAREIKSMRRAAVALLTNQRQATQSSEQICVDPVVPQLLSEAAQRTSPVSTSYSSSDCPTAKVRVLCRTLEQAEAASRLSWLDEITLDFLEIHGLRGAVQRVQQSGKRVVVATPRILKPDEQRLWRFYLSLNADALLLRSAGFLQQLNELGGPGARVGDAHIPSVLYGDFSLNAANILSTASLLSKSLSRLTPTHDLNVEQLIELARAASPQQRVALEAIVHQHLPIFHTEHCVFCRFLSDGNSYKDCGHPCENNTVHLRDDKAQDHLVLADMGCRNTIFNAQAQSALLRIHDLLAAGYRSLRVELVDEPADVVAPILQAYHDVIMHRRSIAEVWSWLQELPDANGNVHGCTEGSFVVRKEQSTSQMKLTAAAAKHRSSTLALVM